MFQCESGKDYLWHLLLCSEGFTQETTLQRSGSPDALEIRVTGTISQKQVSRA